MKSIEHDEQVNTYHSRPCRICELISERERKGDLFEDLFHCLRAVRKNA